MTTLSRYPSLIRIGPLTWKDVFDTWRRLES